ncbi:MAG: FkbM family methyltransferase, partial [Verrucomicrobiota bacterium]
FLDCGANIGYFSVMAGKLVGKEGRVISVEANPVTYRLLQRNLVLNLTGEAVHCALTPTPGTLELFVPKKGGDVYSSTRKGGLVQGEEIEVIEVMGRTLDDVVSSLDLDRVDLIKIDIEGGELDVLQSAFRVLQEKRPVVICEYGTNTWPAFGASPQKLLRFLEECNYSVGTFDINLHTVRPATDEVWQLPYANLILQPR